MRLLDTNIVSFIMKGHTLAASYQPHFLGHTLAVSFQTLAELFEGGVLAGWGDAKWAALDATLAPMTVLHSDASVCEYWARVRATRRAQPMPVADGWIAATALAYGLDLVTHNPADFQGVPGLVVITEAP